MSDEKMKNLQKYSDLVSEDERIIETQNLIKTYRKMNALDDISIVFPDKGIIGLIGRNGSGKTTLIKTIAGQLIPTSGNIKVFSENPYNNINTASNMVYLYSDYGYQAKLMIKEILVDYNIMYDKFDLDFAKKLCHFFELPENLRYDELSQGMASAFNFICAIACRTKLVLLDEPILGMDLTVRKRIYEILVREYLEHPRTFIISSHLLSELEGIITDVILIDNGKCILQAKLDDLQQNVYKVEGDDEKLDSFCKDKNLIYRFKGNINNFAIVNEHITDTLEDEIKKMELSAEAVKVEDLFVYLTNENKGEDISCLWK